jgi:acyl carrier protein
MSLTAQDVIAILRDELFVEVSEVTERSPLFSAGVIDSFSLVGLISELERRAGFRVAPLDITLENFDTIERIVGFVGRQRSRRRAAAG